MNRIYLLPEHISNQIAAGEVVQRPANIIKELVENALDASATHIQVFIEEAGKKMLRIVDDGTGMSETDARLCFTKHATSKLRKIEDLSHIHSMGFRGEALAAISAVAKVSLKTKTDNADNGILIEIENSQILKEEPCATPRGCDLYIRHLFFNVPARKVFLKSNSAENQYNFEAFIRLALAHPAIGFQLYNNGKVAYNLPGNTQLKKRITDIFGKSYDAKILPLTMETDYVQINGYIGKPETKRSKRGEQFFFINRRFIKNYALHQALMSAYQHLIPEKTYPFYALFITIDPARIDINIHPTKEEVKFEDTTVIYNYLKKAVQSTLNQFAITPTIDFDSVAEIETLPAVRNPHHIPRTVFKSDLLEDLKNPQRAHFIPSGSASQSPETWKAFFKPLPAPDKGEDDTPVPSVYTRLREENWLQKDYLQIHTEWLITGIANGILFIHQQYAHEIVLYERLVRQEFTLQPLSTQELFPIKLTLHPQDALLFDSLQPALTHIGYRIEKHADHYLVRARPALFQQQDIMEDIDHFLDIYKYAYPDESLCAQERLLRCIALKNAVKVGQVLHSEEMRQLAQDLFDCPEESVLRQHKKPFIIIPPPAVRV